MKPALAVSFLAAVACHALLLFGVHMGTVARPLAMSDEPSSVDVNLVEQQPEPVPSATPAPTPEPPPPPPEPTPSMPQVQVEPPPTPGPEPVVVPSTPAPQPPREKLVPRAPDLGRPKRMVLPSATANTPSAPVTTRASYRSNPKPDYPEEARRQHQEGVVLLSVEVGTDGRPSSVSLKNSSGFPLLDQAAIQAVKRWTFEPARSGPLAVASRVDVPVRFNLAH